MTNTKENQMILLLIIILFIELSVIAWVIIKKLNHKKQGILTSRTILFAGTYLTAFILFLGWEFIMNAGCSVLITLLRSIHNSIRIFVVDYPYKDFLEDIALYETNGYEHLVNLYRAFIGFLFILAPCLTFDLVLSFLGNTYARLRLWCGFFRTKCIFTELNLKSISLAESIYESDRSVSRLKRRMIVFDRVGNEQSGETDDLIDRAGMINAVVFRKSSLLNRYRAIPGKLMFFVMCDNRDDNVDEAVRIRNHYGNSEKITMYIFSSDVMAELFAGAKENEHIKIRRIDEARALIYRTLYDMETGRIASGTPDLFTEAVKNAPENTVSAVIIGMGEYGEEMLKALTWMCQMEGFRVKIDAFDTGHSAEKRLKMQYSELMEKSSKDANDPGDSQYEIAIHSDVEVESSEFADQIKNLKDATYVFVALDSDEANISTSVYVRRIFEKNGRQPMIHAVVHDTNKAQILKDGKNFRGVAYGIHCIGDLKTLYSEQVILNSELERDALNIHLKYNQDDSFKALPDAEKNMKLNRWIREFYMYEYFYHSSIASALHLKARIACGLQGAGVVEDERKLSVLEHRRWNTYMRTEGYCYSGSHFSGRNDLAKKHNLIVPFDELSEDEKKKDRRVSLD